MRVHLILFLITLATIHAQQLPVARLLTIFPPGAQIGTATEVGVAGTDLDDARELRFSNSGITAALKPDGRYVVNAATNVPAGSYDVRVIGRFGASSPRAFVIGTLPEVISAGTNRSLSTAQEISAGTVVNGKAIANVPEFFKIKAHQDQRLLFECVTRRIDSRMDAVMVLFDDKGKELAHARTSGLLEFTCKRDGDVILKLYDVTYRGGDEYWYRLSISAPASPPPSILESTNTVVTIPFEIEAQFYPAGDSDTYQFEAAMGDILTIEIISHRLGLSTDPFALVQRVTKNDKGEEQLADVKEMYDDDQNSGGPEFNTSSRDPIWRLEAKEAGTYRVTVRDLFNKISDPRRIYRLSIRKETPDFSLIAYIPAPPPLNKDAKEVGTSGLFLRRGDSVPLRVLAMRRENFSGPIDISVEGLPAGVTAAPLQLNAGINNGLLILSASETAAAWTGSIQVVGKSGEIIRKSRAGTILWNVGDYNNEAVANRLCDELVLSVSGAELAPLAIAPEKAVEAAMGAKVNVPITIVRRDQFNGPLKFKSLLEPPKEFEVDGKATNATFEVDLAVSKLAPGVHHFTVYATSPGKYRRITPDEAKGIETEIKTLKEKEPANARIKTLEERLQYRDITATVYASAAISVLPAPQKTP